LHFDEKAQQIILTNSDCIVSKESENLIKEFVEQIAEHNYNIQHWREDGKWDKKENFTEQDFNPQNNNTDFEIYKKLTRHAKGMGKSGSTLKCLRNLDFVEND